MKVNNEYLHLMKKEVYFELNKKNLFFLILCSFLFISGIYYYVVDNELTPILIICICPVIKAIFLIIENNKKIMKIFNRFLQNMNAEYDAIINENNIILKDVVNNTDIVIEDYSIKKLVCRAHAVIINTKDGREYIYPNCIRK